ncbi:PREDICTED: RNA polymerase II-associated protein 1-like isoform X2 [Nicrophorus vespilloides]|uniref:RNA polymerase II-associated protein 1-like isoform X2 n=1 Tax=Nicrophorus vespilloides TaxID=110193 RepID=A0ABM1MDY4_NICVS|nr:PREDICTED: RNA polymerase II-associated protein 1-like isoform X2 [Nicrophorus vespilloides]
MYQKPNPGETHRDLLRLQEEFYKHIAAKKIKLASIVVSAYEKPEKKKEESTGESSDEISVGLDNGSMDIPKNGNERISFKRPPGKFKFTAASGFPPPMRRDVTLSTGGGNIFSQMKKLETTPETTPNVLKWADFDPQKRNIAITRPGLSSVISSFERELIHFDNIDLLARMTQKEIIQERENIISMMDPAILAFLKSNRLHSKETGETCQPSDPKQFEDLQIAIDPEFDKWLNYDMLKSNKLTWFQILDVPKLTKESHNTPRFDYNGWLLPFTSAFIIDCERGRALYHQGDEPGYTFQELFQMCRSNVYHQKLIGLNTIANILGLEASGIYDEVIKIPIEQMFFVLRLSAENKSLAVLNASFKAMRNLFYNPIDESCLDNLWSFGLGLVQPILAIDNEEKSDDKTIKDQQLVRTNLIKCLMRSNILIRIKYILNTVKPCLETIIYLIEILTRLARDSKFVVMQVFECEGLLQNIITNFVPDIMNLKNIKKSHGQATTYALKFLRILSGRSRNIAIAMINKYKIVDSILSYLINEAFFANMKGMMLQIEAFRLWSTFARYGLTIDRFKDFQHVLLKLLNYHLKNSDITSPLTVQAHLSSLLILISEVTKHDFGATKVYYQLLLDLGVTKWFTQFKKMQKFKCGKLQIVSSVLVAMTTFIMFKPNSVGMSVDRLINIAENMVGSYGFELVTEDIQFSSNLLNNNKTHKSRVNFKYTEAAIWNSLDHVIPVLKSISCIPFLRVFSDFVESTENRKLMITFLSNADVQFYLKLVNQAYKYDLTSNWYTRVESGLLLSIIKIAIEVQNSIDTGLCYGLAMKTLSIYHEEQKPDIEYVIRNAIFSPDFYPLDVFLAIMNIEDAEDITRDTMKAALDNIDDIFYVYMNVLGLKKLKVNPLRQSFDVKIGNALPIDWIYTPIITLYAQQQDEDNNITEDDLVFTITNCLRWVYIYETYFPNLASMIDSTERFCRLACTFLGSDSLFLIPEVGDLLWLCLRSVLISEDTLDFERNIHGLCNFQDFFTQLLEQYEGVSYCDILFSNFVLIPLAQKHDVKYRKALWSEYTGVVQVFNLTEKDMALAIESFLEPEETDVTLLNCYQRVLASGKIRTNSVLYKIAKHHWKKYIARRNTNENEQNLD